MICGVVEVEVVAAHEADAGPLVVHAIAEGAGDA
jgi:hypothetical protein